MADKYYRLVSFLVNICPQTLRKLFVKYMKADLTRLPTCTTLGGYLGSKKQQLQILRKKNIIRQDQWNLLFPKKGLVDESSWDTTLVILLIDKFFEVQLHKIEKDAINDIRRIRNRLQHIADTSITDVDFDDMWKTLETATIDLARQIQPSPMYEQTIKENIDDTKVNNMPKLGDTLRYWYENTIFKLQSDLEDMKDTTLDNLKCATDCRTILQANVVTKDDSSGNIVKRLKTVDPILAKMNQRFITTMKEYLKPGYQSPKEIADVKTKLRDTHYVIVTGIGGSHYRETALTAVQDIGYNPNRCVEMRSSSDWRHIDTEEVDLVLCTEPFGDFSFDKDKKRAKIIDDIVDTMIRTARLSDRSQHPAIVIVSESEALQKVSNINEQDLLKAVVYVCHQTSENNPAVLPVSSEDREVSATLQNLLDFTAIFKEKHIGNNIPPKVVFDQAKTKLKKDKFITITGPRKSGKTSLALSLASGYQPQQILILLKSDDMKFVALKCICILIIEDFAGKHFFEEGDAAAWLRQFDLLKSIVDDGKLNVIVTCEETLLQQCFKEIGTHPFLENHIILNGTEIVMKREKVDEDVHCAKAIATDDAQDTTERSSEVNKGDKKQPFSSEKTVIKRVEIPNPKNRDWHDFCQYKDGSYMFVSIWFNKDRMKLCLSIHHFSSGFQYIRKYKTDISANNFSSYPRICCTATGDLVLAGNDKLYQCRITGGTFKLVKSKQLSDLCLVLCFSINRIACLLYGTYGIEVLDENLKMKETVTFFRREFDDEDDDYLFFVTIPNQTYVYSTHIGDIVFEDKEQMQLKYLREEGFEPLCACAADEDSVFVFGRQGGEHSRILHVNTDVEILTDILLGMDELPFDVYERYKLVFDTHNSLLVLLETYSNKINEIYLK